MLPPIGTPSKFREIHRHRGTHSMRTPRNHLTMIRPVGRLWHKKPMSFIEKAIGQLIG